MEFVRINPNDIKIGQPLPWSVYCAEQAMLLQKGTMISSKQQIGTFVERGLFRRLNPEEIVKSESKPTPNERRLNPFAAKEAWSSELAELLPAIVAGEVVNVCSRVATMTKNLQKVCDYDADTLLAAVHLSRGYAYTVVHPVHTAILCELLGKRLRLDERERGSILAAALTMNLGMLETQDVLFAQQTPLTDAQKKEIFLHPSQSVNMLKQAGVTDELWLEAVGSHHEKVDGSGYPKRLQNDEICQAARIIALADMYSALVTPRMHRSSLLPKDALKSVFEKRGEQVDESLAAHLIREVGVFPPGTYVRLANGDTAVVTRRAMVKNNRDSTAPKVYSLISPRGGVYENPHERDCSQALFKITETCILDLPESVDPLRIWNY